MSDILNDEELRKIAKYHAARSQQTAAGVRRAVAGTGAGAAGIPLQALDLPNARVGGLTAAQAEQLKQAYAALLGEGQKALGDYVAGREKEVLGNLANQGAKVHALLEQIVSSSGSVAGAVAGAQGSIGAATATQIGGAYQDARKRYLDAVEAATPGPVVIGTNEIIAAYKDRVASDAAGGWFSGKVKAGPDEAARSAVTYLGKLLPNDQGIAAERLFQQIPGLRELPEMAEFASVAQTARDRTQQLSAAANEMSVEALKELAKIGAGANVTGPMKEFMKNLGLTPEVVAGLLDQGAQAKDLIAALTPLGGEDTAKGMAAAVGEDRDRILAEMGRLGDVAEQAGRPAPVVAREQIEASPEFAAFREDLARKNPSAAVAPANAVFRQYLKTGADALQGSRRATAAAGKALRSEGAEPAPAEEPAAPPVEAPSREDATPNAAALNGQSRPGEEEEPLRLAGRRMAMGYGVA